MSQAKMIKPSIGRRVWFWPGASHMLIGDASVAIAHDLNQPLDAGVAYVHNDRLINISFADQDGQMHNMTSVTLVQPGDETPVGSYCTWMDYQINAAAKDEPAAAVTASTPSSDASIEAEIIAKGLTAARVTLADLNANIADVEIVKHVSKSGQVLRWAVLTTCNGFAVAGKPSCSVSSENDDAQIGEKVALDNAKSELWPLMGYELKSKIAAPKAPVQCSCKPGDGVCNSYCIGLADAPPAAQSKPEPEQHYEGPDHGE